MRRLDEPDRTGFIASIGTAAMALAGLVAGTGCTHNYYYYPAGASPAYVVPGEPVVMEEVCELPGRVISGGSRIVSQGATVVSGAASNLSSRSSRAIISEPTGGAVAHRGWSPARGDIDQFVTTEVHGDADASVIR